MKLLDCHITGEEYELLENYLMTGEVKHAKHFFAFTQKFCGSAWEEREDTGDVPGGRCIGG